MPDRFLATTAALLLLLLAGCESPTHMGPAPPFTLPSAQGGFFSLTEHQGSSPVVINFFATW